MRSHFFVFAFALIFSGCQETTLSPRVTVNADDGQPLPQTIVAAGASQATISRSITVPAGASTKIGFIAFINPDCTNIGYATARVTQPPAHGSLEIGHADDFGYWQPQNPRSECNKRRVPGVIIHYKAQPGFVGVDGLTYEIFGPGPGMRRFNLTINVL